jgi:hypothetical protein
MLDNDDQLLLKRAYDKLHEAECILRFLSDHFRDKYKLNPGDSIAPNGEIQTLQSNIFERLENSWQPNTRASSVSTD